MAYDILEAQCVLVIGATAGIGRALALALHDLPSKPMVIIGGRRQERIDELTGTSDRIKGIQIDVKGGRSQLRSFVVEVTTQYPNLDAVIFSSGIQHIFDFSKPEEMDLDHFEDELTTNYTSLVTLITLFLPHLLGHSKEGRPTYLIPISSGLGIIPAPSVPCYSATKAAVHSLCLSLETQLQDTKVNIIEIIPPLVESELHDHQGLSETLSKFWMPLEEFTSKTMDGLKEGKTQIPIGRSASTWEQFEKDKLPIIQQSYEAFKKRKL